MINVRYSKTIFISLLLVSLMTNISYSQSTVLKSVTAEPNIAVGPPQLPDYFLAQFEDCSYKIKPNGVVTKYFRNKPDSIVFKLDVYKGFSITDAEVCQFKNFLIISFTEYDSESAGSTIEKFNLADLKKGWTFSGLGFNLSALTLHNDYVYLSSFGSIGKVNLYSGEIAFQFRDLYDRETDAFNSFSGIQFKNDTVVFLSQNWKTNRINKIIINDNTNKLITIDK